MVNFIGPLAAEIISLVWGTPANFNRFRVLAALLHGTLVVGVSQTLRVEHWALPIFGRAAITLGTGPHFQFLIESIEKIKLECAPMPNVMAAQPNIGGALCESSVIPFLVPPYVVQGRVNPRDRAHYIHVVNPV